MELYILILSEIEIIVLRLMCEGKSTREIAEIVELGQDSLELVRNKLKSKTNTESTAGLIMFAVRNKILDQGK